MPDPVLGARALNRALLDRQLLSRRSTGSALAAVRRLVALQAQLPNPPYLGLWARLVDFDRDALARLLHERLVVRSPALRATQHLVAAADYEWLRPLLQPVMDRGRLGAFGRRTAGVDLAELAMAGRTLLSGRTLTRTQLRGLLAERWPRHDADALAWSVQYLVPLVHTPPNGLWDRGGAVRYTIAEDWLGRPVASRPSADELVGRYLAAFGPAGIADLQTWSGLTGLRELVEPLRPRLRTFRGEAGAELFDLPDGPLPGEDGPAPPRFLPAFDNLLVAHADRTRIVADRHRGRVITGSLVRATVLVDGFVRGTWTIRRHAGAAILTVDLFEAVPARDRAALAEEGDRLLAFTAGPGDRRDVRIAVAG